MPAWGKKDKSAAAPAAESHSGIATESSHGSPPEQIEKNEQGVVERSVVLVTGKVRLVGGGPFPELVITVPGKEWHIPREEEHKLKDLQQQMVTVEGEETVAVLRLANGMPAGEHRTLENVKIIAVQAE